MSDMINSVEPLIPALRRCARAMLRDRHAADDVVQDCLERVIGHWHQRRAEGDPRSWVFAILFNLVRGRARRATRQPLHVAIDDADPSEFAQAASQEQHIRHREMLEALSRLPEDQRAVLVLVAVEDLSYAEAARTLDVPIGTVMSRLSRARERLSREIELGAGPRVAQPHLRRVK